MNFLFIGTGKGYAPDKSLTNGLRENGHGVFELPGNYETSGKYRSLRQALRKNTHPYDRIIVGYCLPLLVPAVFLFSRKKAIFNAVCSQYEANVISRNTARPWSLGACKWWLIDFLSFHLSSFVLLESDAQRTFVRKHFFVPQKKLVRSRMGVDENVFFFDPEIKKYTEFTVLFRGRFLPESGILTVIEAAKMLEDKGVKFLVIGHGFMYREVGALMKKLAPKNLTMLSETLPPKELRKKMLACHISLGQLARHPRLERTLPGKLFESLALKLPYLTGRNKGVLELLQDNETCITTDPENAPMLAEKILFLKTHPETLQRITENGYALYREKLTSKILVKDLLENLLPQT